MAIAEPPDVALAGVGASFEPPDGIARETARRGTGQLQARDSASVTKVSSTPSSLLDANIRDTLVRCQTMMRFVGPGSPRTAR